MINFHKHFGSLNGNLHIYYSHPSPLVLRDFGFLEAVRDEKIPLNSPVYERDDNLKS